MRTAITGLALASCIAAATTAFAYEPEKPIKVDTRSLSSHVAQQVEERAAESTKALMEYLWFTRKIHHLWLDDLTRVADEPIAMEEPKREPRQMATRTTGVR